MLTLDTLRQFGVNVNEGMARCMNNEAFYLRMVNMSLGDQNFNALRASVESNDRKAAFEAAHALKGVTGNLSLTPLYNKVCELTEQLRPENAVLADSKDLIEQLISDRDALDALAKQ